MYSSGTVGFMSLRLQRQERRLGARITARNEYARPNLSVGEFSPVPGGKPEYRAAVTGSVWGPASAKGYPHVAAGGELWSDEFGKRRNEICRSISLDSDCGPSVSDHTNTDRVWLQEQELTSSRYRS